MAALPGLMRDQNLCLNIMVFAKPLQNDRISRQDAAPTFSVLFDKSMQCKILKTCGSNFQPRKDCSAFGAT
jgi:hypothetical protein